MNVFLPVMKESRSDQENCIQKDRKPVHEIDLCWMLCKPTEKSSNLSEKKGENEL